MARSPLSCCADLGSSEEELPFSSAQKRGDSEGKGGNGSSPAAGHIQDTLPHSRTIVLSVQRTYVRRCPALQYYYMGTAGKNSRSLAV